MRYPKFLRKDGTVGFIAPSFGCNIEPYHTAFRHALEKWQQMGYQAELGPNCFEGSGVGISNTPEKCGAEVNEFFLKRDCDVILSCGGGELMCEVLPFVDFAGIAQAEPKWFMGFSDNTNLTFLLPVLCDTAAIYGPCAPAFGQEPWHPVLQDAWGLLTGAQTRVSGFPLWEKESLKTETNPLASYHVTEEKRLITYLPDGYGEDSLRMKGRMIGGCLDCLGTLVGTGFDRVQEFLERYREDGFIWFLEACDLNPMGIRRTMWQLREAGWFEHVNGFLIGRPLCFGEEMMGLDTYQAVYEVIKEYQVPVIMDVDLGHLPPSLPIISGGLAEVEWQGDEIGIQYIY